MEIPTTSQIIAVAVIAALSGLTVVIGKVTVSIIKATRNGKEKDSLAGVTFEERLAFVENKTLLLETNHLEHLQADVREISKSISDVRERLAKLETKTNHL